jgi:hypothetical protein
MSGYYNTGDKGIQGAKLEGWVRRWVRRWVRGIEGVRFF